MNLQALLSGVRPVEVIAAMLLLVSVALQVQEVVWGWPVGAAAVALYGYVYHEERLYANMGLQAVNFALQGYGWFRWAHGGRQRQRPIRCLGAGRLLALTVAGLAAAAILGLTLGRHTNAARPFWDSTITSLSLVAQWALARKLLESWLFWAAVDLLSIGLYFVQQMYPSLGLYCALLVLTGLGYRHWQRAWREQAAPGAP